MSYLLRLFLPAVCFSSYGHICLQADNNCSIDVNVVFVLCAQRCSFLLMNFFGVVLLFSVSNVDEVEESSENVLNTDCKIKSNIFFHVLGFLPLNKNLHDHMIAVVV